MRKYFIIPLFLFLASCSHDYFPSTGEEDPVVCMNARLNTADTVHKVQIKGSEVNRTIEMKDAVVNMRVGDGPSDTAHVRQDGFAYFNKVIKASDVIRLSSGKASATVSGLPEPEGSILDASYSLQYYSTNGSTVKVRLRRNPKTDNFYILQLVTHRYAIRDNDQEVLMDRQEILRLDMEPYPLQKYPKKYVMDSDAFVDNDYCDITLMLENKNGLLMGVPHDLSDKYYNNTEGTFEPETYSGTLLFAARVSALTRDDYWTLRYMAEGPNFALGVNTDVLPLPTIPKIYPENVNGGIGLVTVRSAKQIPIAKWELHYDINNYSNPDATPLPIE